MIYYSYRTRRSLKDGHNHLPYGFAHYSYGVVCEKFVQVLENGDVRTKEMVMPEIYPAPSHGSAPRNIHIGFKPFEEIRLLKGAANVAHVAWEFDRLPRHADLPRGHPLRDNVFNDIEHMLSLPDEIWVGSHFTKQIFEKQGLSNVHVVPAPITRNTRGPRRVRRLGSIEFTRRDLERAEDQHQPLSLNYATVPRAEECRRQGGKVFLSILNPGDSRKNLAALVLGFQQYLSNSGRSDLLLVKLVSSGRAEDLRTTITEYIPRHFRYWDLPVSFVECKNILLVPELMTTDELSDLYAMADFYVCPSAAEGQGLPLLEAMAAGVVPISSAETAMADYIDGETAVVIETREESIPLQSAEAYMLADVKWRIAHSQDVCDALERAASMSSETYARLSAAAAKKVQSLYGADHVLSLLLGRIAALGG